MSQMECLGSWKIHVASASRTQTRRVTKESLITNSNYKEE